jgi:hypothetical protein
MPCNKILEHYQQKTASIFDTDKTVHVFDLLYS